MYCLAFLTLMLIPAAVQGAGCNTCGQPVVQPVTFRIVGGHEAVYGAWPWTVMLVEDNFPICAGAIVHNRIILTAAHCFEDDTAMTVSRWQVIAGKYHLLKQDRGEQIFHVERIIRHEGYDRNTVANDVAIMLLKEQMTYTSFIRPICLPDARTVPAIGQSCLLGGWGETHGTGSQEVMNQVTLPVISDNVCSRPDWYGHDFIPQMTFCAGYEEGMRDACTGDSGAPLICKFDDRWYVSGISSWGYGCGERKWPGIYTNVTYFLPWIQKTLNDLHIQMPCNDLVG